MGRNLAQLFATLAELPDAEVAALHPAHTSASVKALLPRLHYYEDGTCIVHHIFGGETCDAVRKAYSDAYLTAHFEVPGEMFTLAMEAPGEVFNSLLSRQGAWGGLHAMERALWEMLSTGHLNFIAPTAHCPSSTSAPLNSRPYL
eukprot:167491-Chlamydomonas_euryale.AAC.4